MTRRTLRPSPGVRLKPSVACLCIFWNTPEAVHCANCGTVMLTDEHVRTEQVVRWLLPSGGALAGILAGVLITRPGAEHSASLPQSIGIVLLLLLWLLICVMVVGMMGFELMPDLEGSAIQPLVTVAILLLGLALGACLVPWPLVLPPLRMVALGPVGAGIVGTLVGLGASAFVQQALNRPASRSLRQVAGTLAKERLNLLSKERRLLAVQAPIRGEKGREMARWGDALQRTLDRVRALRFRYEEQLCRVDLLRFENRLEAFLGSLDDPADLPVERFLKILGQIQEDGVRLKVGWETEYPGLSSTGSPTLHELDELLASGEELRQWVLSRRAGQAILETRRLVPLAEDATSTPRGPSVLDKLRAEKELDSLLTEAEGLSRELYCLEAEKELQAYLRR